MAEDPNLFCQPNRHMEQQFTQESIKKRPKKHELYFVSPYRKSSGLSYLMKLVLCAKNKKCMDYIKKELYSNPKTINEQCDEGWTALMISCRNSNTYSSCEIVKLLLSCSGIDVNITNKEGATAFIVACRYVGTDSNIETVKLLLNDIHIDLNKNDNIYGHTAFTTICINSEGVDTQIMDLLLSQPNLDKNIRANAKWSGLLCVCRHINKKSNVEIAKSLLNNKDIHIDQNDVEHIIDVLMKHNEKYIDIIMDTLVEQIVNRGIFLGKKILHMLAEEHTKYFDPISSRIYYPQDIDYDCMNILVKKCKNKKRMLYYFNLHTNIKEEMHREIISHREQLYCRPGNFVALCSEINYETKYRDKKQIFRNINNKLKILLDIKDEYDMLEKINSVLSQ